MLPLLQHGLWLAPQLAALMPWLKLSESRAKSIQKRKGRLGVLHLGKLRALVRADRAAGCVLWLRLC